MHANPWKQHDVVPFQQGELALITCITPIQRPSLLIAGVLPTALGAIDHANHNTRALAQRAGAIFRRDPA